MFLSRNQLADFHIISVTLIWSEISQILCWSTWLLNSEFQLFLCLWNRIVSILLSRNVRSFQSCVISSYSFIIFKGLSHLVVLYCIPQIPRSRYKQGPWVITLQPNVYHSFLEHCPDTELRRNTYRAYNMRASNHISQDLSNSIHIEEIRSLRYELCVCVWEILFNKRTWKEDLVRNNRKWRIGRFKEYSWEEEK